MKRAAFLLLVLTFSTSSLVAAQGRGNGKGKIPPGHLPPAGQCRAWIDGVPPGHQPPPTSCAEAQRIAAREGGRVIYGAGKGKGKKNGNDRWTDDHRDGIYDRRDAGRAVPRIGGIYQGRNGNSRGMQSFAHENGYRDGLVKGREDDDRNRSYDPARHEWYRSASRGYEPRVGSRGQYSSAYRQGFMAGYESAYQRR